MKKEHSNILEMFFDTARNYPSRPAIYLHDSNICKQYSYADVEKYVVSAAEVLKSDEFRSEELIAAQFANPFWDLIYFLAAGAVGVGVYVPSKELAVERKILDVLRIKRLISDKPVNSHGRKSLVVPCDESLLERCNPRIHLSLESTQPDCPWFVRSSSGTTGFPKLFVTSHLDGMFRRQRYFDAVPMQPGGFLSLTPLRFGAARQRYFYHLCAGQSLHLMQGDPHLIEVVQLINDFSIQQVYGVPMHLKMLCDMARGQRHENGGLLFHHLPYLESSSSLVAEELQSAVRTWVTPRFVNSYSVSEVGHLSSTSDFENFSNAYSDIGSVIKGIDFRILDEDGNQKAPGQIGLMAFRFKDRETKIDYINESGVRTSSLKNGWFFPGDLGYLSENERLFFAGRNDDLIIFNGINIFPAEIETCVKADASIKDACAFGIASELHHQIPCIAVIPADGFNQMVFMDQLKSRLGNKAPKMCIQCQDFPVNTMGKVMRRELSRVLTEKLAAHKQIAQPNRIKTRKEIAVLNDLEHRLRLHLKFRPCAFTSKSDFDLWAQVLMGDGAALSLAARPLSLEGLQDADRPFVTFCLKLARKLLELGRIPVFSDIEVTSIELVSAAENLFAFDLEVVQIHFLPLAAYELTFRAAIRFSHWMAEHPPTPENRDELLKAVDQQVIKALYKQVPGGKSTIPVLKVAHALGVPFLHLGTGVYQLGWGSKARRLDRSSTELDSAMAGKLTQHKATAANLLRLAGLPAPIHSVVGTEAAALAAAQHLGYPVVVKPVDLDRGEGVSVDVADVDSLKVAFEHAQQPSKSKAVIIERQVPGVCCRFFIANGRLLYAVKRLPMSVRGDGNRTITQLVRDELLAQQLLAPWDRSPIQPMDDRALSALTLAGFSPESVPGKGVWAPLRRIESTADGGVDEEVTASAHPDNVAAALSAASLFGLNVAGVDIISADITKPWYENGAIINEVNFAPLLGGAEISRSYLPKFFAEFLDDDGKIPIETFATKGAALAKQAAYRQQGLRCYFVSQTKTCDFAGKQLMMPLNDAKSRVRALLCRADVDAVVICL